MAHKARTTGKNTQDHKTLPISKLKFDHLVAISA
jgi:hypothetical protein